MDPTKFPYKFGYEDLLLSPALNSDKSILAPGFVPDRKCQDIEWRVISYTAELMLEDVFRYMYEENV